MVLVASWWSHGSRGRPVDVVFVVIAMVMVVLFVFVVMVIVVLHRCLGIYIGIL